VIRSVGYKGTHLPGVPFDSAKSVIPSVDGRIIGAERSYVAGWIKRGPSGIIGTNKKDAVATVATLMADLSDQPSSAQAPDYVVSLLKDRGIQYVDLSGWKRIDAAERELGSLSGKERTTIHERKTLLSLAKGN
jgi:ferredoxin--NADP+ reductase